MYKYIYIYASKPSLASGFMHIVLHTNCLASVFLDGYNRNNWWALGTPWISNETSTWKVSQS